MMNSANFHTMSTNSLGGATPSGRFANAADYFSKFVVRNTDVSGDDW